MNLHKLLVVLSVANLALLLFLLTRTEASAAGDIVPVLRGHGLEIVDQRGRVRASISVLPADNAVRMPDGTTGYPETVLLRLITSEGRPNVKLATMESGSGLLLATRSDLSYAQLLSDGSSPLLRLKDHSREQVFKP